MLKSSMPAAEMLRLRTQYGLRSKQWEESPSEPLKLLLDREFLQVSSGVRQGDHATLLIKTAPSEASVVGPFGKTAQRTQYTDAVIAEVKRELGSHYLTCLRLREGTASGEIKVITKSGIAGDAARTALADKLELLVPFRNHTFSAPIHVHLEHQRSDCIRVMARNFPPLLAKAGAGAVLLQCAGYTVVDGTAAMDLDDHNSVVVASEFCAEVVDAQKTRRGDPDLSTIIFQVTTPTNDPFLSRLPTQCTVEGYTVTILVRNDPLSDPPTRQNHASPSGPEQPTEGSHATTEEPASASAEHADPVHAVVDHTELRPLTSGHESRQEVLRHMQQQPTGQPMPANVANAVQTSGPPAPTLPPPPPPIATSTAARQQQPPGQHRAADEAQASGRPDPTLPPPPLLTATLSTPQEHQLAGPSSTAAGVQPVPPPPPLPPPPNLLPASTSQPHLSPTSPPQHNPDHQFHHGTLAEHFVQASPGTAKAQSSDVAAGFVILPPLSSLPIAASNQPVSQPSEPPLHRRHSFDGSLLSRRNFMLLEDYTLIRQDVAYGGIRHGMLDPTTGSSAALVSPADPVLGEAERLAALLAANPADATYAPLSERALASVIQCTGESSAHTDALMSNARTNTAGLGSVGVRGFQPGKGQLTASSRRQRQKSSPSASVPAAQGDTSDVDMQPASTGRANPYPRRPHRPPGPHMYMGVPTVPLKLTSNQRAPAQSAAHPSSRASSGRGRSQQRGSPVPQ